MFKLMKYEVRGTYKFVLGTILTVAIAMSVIQFNVYKLSMDLGSGRPGGSILFTLLVPLLAILMVAASIAFIVYLIQSFRKELYEDRGYLTFTLPLSGKQILGAKLLTAIIWSTLFGAIILSVSMIVMNVIFGDFVLAGIFTQVREFMNFVGGGAIVGFLIYTLVSSLVTLLNVYFSISLSKVALKNKRIGGLWILIFIGLNIVFNLIETMIIRAFPLYINLQSGTLAGDTMLSNMGETGLFIDFNLGNLVISSSAIIYWAILVVGLFLATSHLLDRKIEL